MQNCKDLAFGYKREEIEAKALWGARAIYSTGQVDLLGDRQDLLGDNGALKEKLKRKLNGRALGAFRCWAGDYRFPDNEDWVETFTNNGVKFWASTNRSYGYLYITAALLEG